ncbi:Phosphatidylinositol 3- and 4-kinase family protein, partial [Reticulomyxa filosa]
GKDLLENLIKIDGIEPLSDKDKMLMKKSIAKQEKKKNTRRFLFFLRSVDWLDDEARKVAYDYLERWAQPNNPEDCIELLRHEFADNRVRLYALNNLNRLNDYALNRYLLQLVQALKCELQHNSFLSRFLVYRAVNNPWQIGHYLFWHLKSEYHSEEWCERFGLLMEEYFVHLPSYQLMVDLLVQNNLMNRLTKISTDIQYWYHEAKKSKEHCTSFLRKELELINEDIIDVLTVPLNPCIKVRKLKIAKCRFMSSAKVPLWLCFRNADPHSLSDDDVKHILRANNSGSNGTKDIAVDGYTDICHDAQVLFKSGDDLRQDILTLQMLYIMDELWLRKNLDLRMKPYGVIATAENVGLVELILNCKTANDIHTDAGTYRGSFDKKTHLQYLERCHPPKNDLHAYHKAREYYARSCAGYSVSTWILGIGDRHPSNIMIHFNGSLFHIDFGHFLGNFKSKKIAGYKFEREKTPFVFTPMMKYAIDEGKEPSPEYRDFIKWFFQAFTEVRVRYKMFSNLFLLMIPSHMPELVREHDVSYVRRQLRLDLDNINDLAAHIEVTINDCLNDKNRLWDNAAHAAKHA